MRSTSVPPGTCTATKRSGPPGRATPEPPFIGATGPPAANALAGAARSSAAAQTRRFTPLLRRGPPQRFRLPRTRDAGDLGDRGQAAANLLEPVLAQPHHALVHRRVGDGLGGLAGDGERADGVRHPHDLVE